MPANWMQTDWMEWGWKNFGLVMFILAAIFMLIHRIAIRRISEAEIIYRWVALFALGFTLIYAFVMHVFYSEMAASSIGWQPSPFQFEVAMADLAIGVLGILSFNASFSFRLATVIAATIYLWGAAAGHFYQMLRFQNFTVGNAGSWFWMDIVVPLVLIICLIKMKRSRTVFV